MNVHSKIEIVDMNHLDKREKKDKIKLVSVKAS